ncbi:MAG: glycosyltransferase family 4 protein [Ruminococcaceae bacterium]|nr:glycosyltransferase family 4 protein [Oscillospiraceae bacterium]
MKVLFLESYFKPEKTSGAHLAEDTRRALTDAGHTIQIYAPTPSRGVSDEVRAEYKKRKKETEINGAIHINRFSLYREGRNPLGRAFRYAILEIKLLWFGLFAKNIDLLPMGSTPPINGIIATIIKKLRKIPYVYTVQDLFPDSLVSTGMTKKGSLLWKIGNFVSNMTYKNASHIIVISESIRESLIERGVPAEKISVIYNWIDTDKTYHVDRENNTLFDEFGLARDKFYVTYAGNIGNSQNVDLVVDCAEALKDKTDIRFVIFGDGSEKEKLLQRIEESGLKNIDIFPMQPMERVSEVYSLGDASFVICKKGVGGGAFPSKAASIMATATPVIASFDLDSDLCRTINEHRAGECCEAENAEKAVEIINKLYADRELCKEYGKNARNTACTKFSKEISLKEKIKVFEENAKK